MDEGLCAFNICRKCKRKDWISFTQEDIDKARENGGLFIKLLDHEDHFLELRIDSNGAVRREYILARVLNIQPIIS